MKNNMVEMLIHSDTTQTIRVFDSQKDAEDYRNEYYPDSGSSIYPLGTLVWYKSSDELMYELNTNDKLKH